MNENINLLVYEGGAEYNGNSITPPSTTNRSINNNNIDDNDHSFGEVTIYDHGCYYSNCGNGKDRCHLVTTFK